MNDRTRVRIVRKGDPEPPSDYRGKTAEELLEIAWQLTLSAWELAGRTIEPRLRRDVARIVRRGR